MEFEILKKDKEMEVNRLLRMVDHEKAVSEMNTKRQIKRLEEEIELKDKRYKLLLEEYEKLKKDHQEKRDVKEPLGGDAFHFF